MTLLQRIKTPFAESPAGEQAGSQPRQRQVGHVLQERREDLGLDLDEIGAMLRIKPAYLAALEQGRSDDLPGPAYAIGFVRAYADFLGLDTEQVLARLKGEVAGVTARPDLALPVPLGERSLPGRALVLVALIVTLCGYGIWYYLSTEDRSRPERVAAVPAELRTSGAPFLVSPPPPQPPAQVVVAPNPSPNPAQTAPPPNPAAVAASPNPSAPAKPLPQAATAPPAPATPPQQVVAATQPKPASPAATAPPAQITGPAAVVQPAPPSPAPTAASKISIRALADCWIQVRGPDQSIVFSRILKSGEVYNVPSRAGLWLRTGNAGVLEIAVDGKPAPSIGGIGTLRRDVALDPAELAAGKAVHG
ncbi:MAG TPA: helix-turn-helix domain-containing protein [Stellaceae bacterium]|nr:helix-turn-helix domain-containing protein [Stellaceae bacterium]